jgi:hypothetical protein
LVEIYLFGEIHPIIDHYNSEIVNLSRQILKQQSEYIKKIKPQFVLHEGSSIDDREEVMESIKEVKAKVLPLDALLMWTKDKRLKDKTNPLAIYYLPDDMEYNVREDTWVGRIRRVSELYPNAIMFVIYGSAHTEKLRERLDFYKLPYRLLIDYKKILFKREQ